MKACTIIRFIATTLLSLTCLFFVLKMMFTAYDDNVEYLSLNECSRDELLNESFRNLYYFNLTLEFKNWMSIFMLIFILAIDVIVLAYNFYRRRIVYRAYMSKKVKE